MGTSKINHYHFLLDFVKKPNSSQSKYRLSSYRNFLWVFIFTLLICFLKEPIINLFVIAGNYRRQGAGDWVFYSYRNKEKYLKQIKNRKILISGGSSALFGIDASQIESSTGIPTANMGVSAALGVDYILEKAKTELKSGDVIVLSIEYPLYYKLHDHQLLDNALKDYVISYDHDYLNQLNLVDKLKVLTLPFGFNQDDIDTIINLLLHKSPFDKKLAYQETLERLSTGECYTGLTLNRNGDEQCNVGKSPLPKILKAGKSNPDINERPIDSSPKGPIDPSGSIRDFCKYAKKNRITVVPIFPGTLYFRDYDSEQYKAYFAQIKNFWLQQGIHFEDYPSNSFIQLPMMFETIYHPNEKGRNLRTKSIINILKGHLK